ncbi:MAG: hypothetical protein HY235_29540 [Acidobacteria bacterium]|nr:hypothetical protein [Acidobacteriota bacterium]
MLAEIVIGRTRFVWGLVPDSDLGIVGQIEETIIRGSPDPQVLVFGSSRGRGAFLPTRIEERMGLRRGQVVSLAIGGAHVFDALLIYQRNRSALSKAKMAILDIDPFQFNVGTEPPVRFRQFASWGDRFAYSGAKRWRLLADYVFHMDNALPTFTWYLSQRFRGQVFKRVGIDRYGRLAVVNIADDHDPRLFEERGFRRWVNILYGNYEYSPVLEQELVRLIRMLREDGAAVYLVRIPTAGGFLPMLEQSGHTPFTQFKQNMQRVAHELGVVCQIWESGGDVGLRERDYRDWGHLNTPGAEKWTEFFMRWLLAHRAASDGRSN